MANESTRIHTPAATTPTVTGKVAKCLVCKCTWAVVADSSTEGCSFCDASADAIVVLSEKPGYEGRVV